MTLPNLNKLFPRLSIRAKLVVAFALLATLPLLITGAFGTRETLSQIERSARASLEHELETASQRTEHFLLGAEEDLEYLAEAIVRPAARVGDIEGIESTLQAFIRSKPEFFQIRLITPEGDPVVVESARGRHAAPEGGAYYAYRARNVPPGERALLAVEIRDPAARDEGTAVPAFAIVHPLRDGDGDIVTIVVGEVYAARLFEAIEKGGSSPLGGTVGLVDADGHYLYHSERKRDWNTLLAARPEANLGTELGEDAAQVVQAGIPGTVRAADERMVSFRPLGLSGPDGRPLRLYRAVPASVLTRPARSFLGVVGVGGFLVLGVSMILAVVAATQFTRPIYRLREAAREVAAGEFGPHPEIETNDEIEDLARDFARMADRLREHRQHLEELVADRTSALTEAHAELAEILAHTEDAIVRLDEDGRVRVWNRGAETMFGWTEDEATGRRLDELIGSPGAGEARSGAAAPDSRGVRYRRGGTPVEVGVSRSPIRDPEGARLGYTVILRDETSQRALERQMIRSERLAAAGRLAAGVVHEINNPIGILVNRLDVIDLEIEERYGDDALHDDLRVVRQQAERVGVVARRLLTLARDDEEPRQPMDLNALTKGVVTFLEPELRKRRLRLETDLVPDLPEIVASPHGIETVLLNLALNAMDASDVGDAITIATRVAIDGSAVELVVEDEGAGIPEEERDRIFEPFFTTKLKPRGTGLGLAVCQGVVTAHGGDIRVRSESGRGTRFEITLPVESGEEVR